MKKIFIVGGNGFAGECYDSLIKLEEYGKEVIFGGFLGYGGYGHTVDYKTYQHLYLGEVSEHKFKDDEYCIIGAGYPKLRRKIYEDLKLMNAKFYTLICRGVYLSQSFEYGEANIFVCPFLSSVNIKVGNWNAFNGDASMGHDSEIGNFNFIGPRTSILGNVKIQDCNQIGQIQYYSPTQKSGVKI